VSKELPAGVEVMDFDDDLGDTVADESAIAALSDDELNDLLDSDEPRDEPVDEDEPEAEGEVADEEEAEAPPEEESTEEATEGESEAEAEPEPEITALDLERFRREQAEIRAEHFKLAHDKLSGKYGELKKRADRPYEPTVSTDHDEDAYDGQPAQRSSRTRLESVVEELRQSHKQTQLENAHRAFQATGQAFHEQHPEIKADQAFRDRMAEALGSRAAIVQEALDSVDPDAIARTTNYVLTDAYMEVKGKMLEEQIARRSTDQASDLKTRKKAARVSGSTGKASPSKAKNYKSLEDMPDDVLAAAIDAMD